MSGAAYRVDEVMGAPVSMEVLDAPAPEAALDAAFAALRRADQLFSTYRPESDLSRLNAGEVTLEACAPEVREVIALCARLRERTLGAFDIRAPGRAVGSALPPGGVDPSGLVKGWAVARAAEVLLRAGARRFCLNAAGDVLVGGGRGGGEPWRVGIRDPRRADRVCAVLEVIDGAVATSGAYERGDHVVDPRSGTPAQGLLSVTVVGPDLAVADAYATAVFAMGPSGLGWLAGQPHYAGLVVLPDGELRVTAGLGARPATVETSRPIANEWPPVG